MARGFESKQVESQQEEAQRERAVRRKLSPEEAERLDRQRTLRLARARVTADLERATNGTHRKMLEQALAAIDDQIRLLNPEP